jgi:hypothetical protein
LDGDSYPLPHAPGLGVSVDEDTARAHELAFWEPPHYRRPVGLTSTPRFSHAKRALRCRSRSAPFITATRFI